jgi:hypothetical protein
MDGRRIRPAAAAGALAVVVGAIVAVATLAAERKKDEPYRLVSIDQVEQMLGRPDLVLVDANPQDVYRKNHVPGARWWRSKPLAELLPAERDRPVVFYCASPH